MLKSKETSISSPNKINYVLYEQSIHQHHRLRVNTPRPCTESVSLASSVSTLANKDKVSALGLAPQQIQECGSGNHGSSGNASSSMDRISRSNFESRRGGSGCL